MPRIIPTCVGKTLKIPDMMLKIWDHPHLRGENDELELNIRQQKGSSPLAWGKQAVQCPSCYHLRIIPTCVGKTVSTYTPKKTKWDHPHLRGENEEVARLRT